MPTVAALNGGAYGGGVEIALACDFRVGVTGMRAFAPPAKLGIHYEPAGIRRAIDRLGSQAARRMFLLAETFDAEALLAMGFLDHLVAPEALAAKVAEMTATVAGLAPLAVRGMKRTIVELARGTLDAAAARERIAACFASRRPRRGARRPARAAHAAVRGALGPDAGRAMARRLPAARRPLEMHRTAVSGSGRRRRGRAWSRRRW